MNGTEKKPEGAKAFLLRTLCDPVLMYTVLVLMSIMYHYRSQLTAVYGLASVIAGWALFRVFDFINKHKLIGTAAYIATAVGFSYLWRMCMDKGNEDYPISWGVWFLTPQDSVEYNRWYTLAIYLMFLIFMTSVIYYFTRIRYRIFMNFLIFIIPFAIYGKEYEKMPTVFIILLAVGYILLMVYFRQLHEGGTAVVVGGRENWKSIGVYAVIFASAAALIPKPEVTADRTVLETLINADQFTDRLVAMLNVFRDTSDASVFRGAQDNTPLYYAESKDPMQLKTSTFSTYDYSTHLWSIQDMDSRFRETFEEPPVAVSSQGGLTRAILIAAQFDSDFAERYDLSDFTPSDIYVPELKEVKIYSAYESAQFAPVPQFAAALTDTSYKREIALVRSGLVYSPEGKFGYDESFEFTYGSDRFFYAEKNMDILSRIEKSDYYQLITEARDILDDTYWDKLYYDDQRKEMADAVYEHLDLLDFECARYDEYQEYLLDYGGNERIYELAESLTEGADSEFEKAKILEGYFYSNGYNYDLNYKMSKGENAESFLFETKTGVCYEYATAMVLLARAAGIPARFCEGYNMQQTVTDSRYNVNFVVTSRDAHAFPELYLKGYGWVSFEPTITDPETEQQGASATDLLSRAGLVILAAALIVLLLAAAYPMISHRIFLIRCSKRSPNDTVIAVLRRICRIYGIENVNTSHEASAYVCRISGADIAETAVMFDSAVYGEAVLGEQEKEKALAEYSSAYEALREAKKKRKKRIRKSENV